MCALGRPYTEGTVLYCDYFIWCVSCTVVVLVICGILLSECGGTAVTHGRGSEGETDEWSG